MATLQDPLLETRDAESLEHDRLELDPQGDEEKPDVTLWSETKALLKISLPVSIATLARIAIFSTDAAFIGRLGKAELSGVTLVNCLKDFIGNFGFGWAYVLNSICAQAIGAGNPKLAGNWLQLALGICSLVAIPVTVFWFFGGDMVSLVDHDHGTVKWGRVYAHYGCWLWWPTVIYMTIRQYFQALQVVMPATIVSLLTIGVNFLLNKVLVNGAFGFPGWGLKGSPIATLCSFIFQLALFLLIVLCKGYAADYWGGWTWESFRRDRVKKMFVLVVPMTIGIIMESSGWQIITFLMGGFGEVNVAAMSILYTCWGVLWAFYWGFGLAIQVRVGHHLGEGNLVVLRRTIRASVVLFAILIGALSLLCYFLRHELGKIYTKDPDVLAAVAENFPWLCLDYLFGCFALAAVNILEGMSKNTLIAIVTGVAMWGITMPLFFLFVYRVFKDKPIMGAWIASGSGQIFVFVVLWYKILTMDLHKLHLEARKRNEAMRDEGESDSKRPTDDTGEEEAGMPKVGLQGSLQAGVPSPGDETKRSVRPSSPLTGSPGGFGNSPRINRTPRSAATR